MTKLFSIIPLVFLLASCSTEQERVDYFIYDVHNFEPHTHLELKVIENRLISPLDSEFGFANSYLCRNLETNGTVQVVSLCTKGEFEKDTYVRLYPCDEPVGDSLTAAFDLKWMSKYDYMPIYFGGLAIPVQ